MMQTDTQQPMPDEADSPRKFLFDLSFDNGMNKRPKEKEKPKPTFTQEDIDNAFHEGHTEGIQAGRREVEKEQAQRNSFLLLAIEKNMGQLVKESQTAWAQNLVHAQSLAVAIAQKLMPLYINEHGAQEIESVVGKVLAEVGREPRLVFRISEEVFDDVGAKIQAIANKEAYAGKVVILGDKTMGPSDCRIEWADGGIERNTAMIWQEIERLLQEVHGLNLIEKPAPITDEQPTPDITQQPTDGGDQKGGDQT